jgi:hypothetical protein
VAVFVKESKLNSEIESVFEEAKQCIIIISPYIKLHARFIEILKGKKDDPNIEIIVVFDKNESDLSKSINLEDVQFLMSFPNIKIKYEPRLHAKYYSNESSSVLSSMNLYDFSQDNNIEFGIVTKARFLGSITNSLSSTLDKDAFDYFKSVINNSKCLFQASPEFEKKMLGLGKKYVGSKVETDELSNHFMTGQKTQTNHNRNKSFNRIGYCIRYGYEIEFNPEKPMSIEAFQMWKEWGNPEYDENYCHLTGEPSYGETSMAKPFLWKNYQKVKNEV